MDLHTGYWTHSEQSIWAFAQWLYTYRSIIYLSFSAFDRVFQNGCHGRLWKCFENTENPCIKNMTLKLKVKGIIRDDHQSPFQKTHLKTPNTVQNRHLDLSSARKLIIEPSGTFSSTIPRGQSGARLPQWIIEESTNLAVLTSNEHAVKKRRETND